MRNALSLASLLLLIACLPEPRAGDGLEAPAYDDGFWKHWGDGQAEIAAYDLVFPRYGEPRSGTAVAIFVTEPFSRGQRVKAERPGSDVFQVLKLNWIQDFPTGIYDYNLMTSTFVALEPVQGRPAGSVTKVSFTAQEWCGHVYAQALFDPAKVRLTSHSYFDGEADRSTEMDYPTEGLAEEALLLWARGLAAPHLEPGSSQTIRLLDSLESSRLGHRPSAWHEATLSRTGRIETVVVPAGELRAEVLTVEVPDRANWTFWVEQTAPRRLVRWSRDDGLRAELVGSNRVAYWTLNGPGLETTLSEIGLRPRPPRTP